MKERKQGGVVLTLSWLGGLFPVGARELASRRGWQGNIYRKAARFEKTWEKQLSCKGPETDCGGDSTFGGPADGHLALWMVRERQGQDHIRP